MHLDAHHAIARVAGLAKYALIDRLDETRPTRAGVELIRAAEKRRVAADAAVKTCLFIIVVAIRKWALGALFTRNVVLKVSETLLPFRLSALNRVIISAQVHMRGQAASTGTFVKVDISRLRARRIFWHSKSKKCTGQ